MFWSQGRWGLGVLCSCPHDVDAAAWSPGTTGWAVCGGSHAPRSARCPGDRQLRVLSPRHAETSDLPPVGVTCCRVSGRREGVQGDRVDLLEIQEQNPLRALKKRELTSAFKPGPPPPCLPSHTGPVSDRGLVPALSVGSCASSSRGSRGLLAVPGGDLCTQGCPVHGGSHFLLPRPVLRFVLSGQTLRRGLRLRPRAVQAGRGGHTARQHCGDS